MTTDANVATPRADAVERAIGMSGTRETVRRLVALCPPGLSAMRTPDGRFVQTLRRVATDAEPTYRQEGLNPRYSAIAALGAARLDETLQHEALGTSAVSLAKSISAAAKNSHDVGAVALALWAIAELDSTVDGPLLENLSAALRNPGLLPTVDASWALTALVTCRRLGDLDALTERTVERLLAVQGRAGIFAHNLTPAGIGWYRAHIGCFADQVYPIQALARYHAATAEVGSLAAANLCAEAICAAQGKDGQWWWHYDVRSGAVVETYPVYSVHQHAMAPMALLDLLEAGGADHRTAVARGLRWLGTHPEVPAELISEEAGVVWRKVGRREPPKFVRSLRSMTTALRPRLRLGALDAAFPAVRIDYECRPYELGWLLYAWLSDGVVAALRDNPPLPQSAGQ